MDPSPYKIIGTSFSGTFPSKILKTSFPGISLSKILEKFFSGAPSNRRKFLKSPLSRNPPPPFKSKSLKPISQEHLCLKSLKPQEIPPPLSKIFLNCFLVTPCLKLLKPISQECPPPTTSQILEILSQAVPCRKSLKPLSREAPRFKIFETPFSGIFLYKSPETTFSSASQSEICEPLSHELPCL